MKIALSIVTIVLAVFLAAAVAQVPEKNDLKATYTLSGVLQDLENKELTVTFSDDMLPLGGKRDGASLIRITPSIKGEFSWRGNRTLAFKPAPRFRYSTTYTAAIPAGTRSLAGKTLPRGVRWQWSTPLAYPVEVKAGAQEYFSDLAPGQKLHFQVWVRDALVLRFNQPVPAAGAGDLAVLREAKSGVGVELLAFQKAGNEIEFRHAQDLKRGTVYEFILKKGFRGSEGATGTQKDFSFSFATVPAFIYTGKKPLTLFPDEPRLWLTFSNPLAEFDPGLIKVFKISGKDRLPLAVRSESRHYDNEALFLSIDGHLASGDALLIQIQRALANIYKEPLPASLELEARVCSSRSPRIDFSMQGKTISLATKSLKKAGLRMFKLKPGFFAMLEQRAFGLLQRQNFAAEFVEKELRQTLDDLPEKEKTHVLAASELGHPLGFFAFLVQRYEPYNSCADIGLMRLPAFNPPVLEVFHRRNMDMVIKAGREQTLFWLYDNRSGKNLGKLPLFIKGHDRETQPIGESAANGVLLSARGLREADLVLARKPVDGDMALAHISHDPPLDREVRISVFSERDFYRPGDTVHIAGVIKEYASGKVSSPKAATAALVITGPDRQQVKADTLRLDPLGGFRYEFKSDPDGKKGNYQVAVKFTDTQNWQGQHGITIDHYQPNTMEVTISGMAERYLPADMFRPLVRGSYLSGNPMAGDELAYSLTLAHTYEKVFASAALERYRFSLDPDLARRDPPQQGGSKLDAEGGHTLGIPMSRFKDTNFAAKLGFSATGKSAEGKEFTSRAQSLFFPGKLLAGIHIGYYQDRKEEIEAELALVDHQGKPAAGEIRVTLYREYHEGHKRKLKKIGEAEDLFVDKNRTYAFRVPEAGHYILRCDASDAEDRMVSTSSGFFAWGYGYSEATDRLRIESVQTSIHTGETLKCFIHSPREGQALVTIERGKVLDSRVMALQKMTPLDIPVKKDYFPAMRVSVIAMYENNVSEETARDFQVEDKGKALRVSLEFPTEIKPASNAKVRIKVSDWQNIGMAAKLFVYAVDEGNLSLRNYRTPDPHDFFYYRGSLRNSALRTYYSKNYTRWTFARPTMDIDLPQPAIYGCVFKPDATPLAGAIVTLEDENHQKLKSATTSAQGYYRFSGMPGGRYAIKAEARGFHPFLWSDIYFDGSRHRPCDIALLPSAGGGYWDPADEFGPEGRIAGGVMPAPMAAEMKSMARMKEEGAADGITGGVIGGVLGGVEAATAGIRVRSDFREVLFFKTVETDGAGNATVDIASSDQLSTYRIMAVAYSEDSFGAAEKKIMVSKDLLISEAMPEFARQGDEFSAGAQLSNRTSQKLAVTLLAKPQGGIALGGAERIERVLDARGNSLFQFPFRADRVGTARVEFFALSAADRDGLEKKLFVGDRLVRETLLDFASGNGIRKRIEPQAGVENQSIRVRVDPSLLTPAVSIAKKLVFYPYECLEQRASKVMPFLAFSPQLAERLELGLDRAQIRAAVDGYIQVIPEFMNAQGALSYYRGGQYPSDYLTAYVLWSLHLARQRDHKVDPRLMQKLSSYLQRSALDRTCAAFYQFVLSLGKGADGIKLKKLAAERDGLPLPARVFLYRAMHNQGIGKDLLSLMLAEFNNSLQVEADFAYFDAGEFTYQRDFPFYSSRFATALLVQAVLEVEGGHVLAERIMRWLLEAEPHCWNTTQTNFWVLCAMDEYLRKVEKTIASRAEIDLLGEKSAQEFTGSRDSLQVQKKLADRKEPVDFTVQADQPVYVTSELTWQLARAGKKSRGIDIQRNVYNEKGEAVSDFQRGQVYMVELLVKSDKEVPYGVVDEPLAAGFELLRQDIASTRALKEFNSKYSGMYHSPWARQENAADRLVFYTYSMQGPLRFIYFIKAMYAGRFTWMPTMAQGMYHPQYFGRTAIQTIEVRE
jgi:uncharacterized protein YfaS (alpha-2-macroglobulin family)